MIRPFACAAAIALTTALPAPTMPSSSGAPPGPTVLLLAPADLPGGYVSDDALENADATARTSAYSSIIVQSAFAGYRTAHAAVVQYVALLRRRTDASLFVTREADAVARERGAARLTLAGRYGDGAVLAYQQAGARGEEWTIAVFSDGRYVTAIGSYDASGEQTAIDLLQRLAAIADARLRAAARLAPATAPASHPPREPALRIVALTTVTRQGRASDTFRPHSAVYWRAEWQVGRLPRGARETLHEWVGQGKRVLYTNGMADRPYSGDNALSDHLQLGGVAPGTYGISIAVSIGRLSTRATHTFLVLASPPKRT